MSKLKRVNEVKKDQKKLREEFNEALEALREWQTKASELLHKCNGVDDEAGKRPVCDYALEMIHTILADLYEGGYSDF